MHLDKVSLADTHAFSPFFLDYIQQNDKLKTFYDRFPLAENFRAQIEEKAGSFPKSNRTTLVSVLGRQYDGFNISETLAQNLTNLKEANTFTVTTGHQLNIFTGPLYFIFKIITVINTCKKLKIQYPDYNFVPVYWMASEDHDYDEIKYFRLYGRKHVWETEQQGAVGRFNTAGLDAMFNEIPGETTIFRTAYTKYNDLSSAVRYYVNELFGNRGLVVIDADDRTLKSEFREVMVQDIIGQVNKPLVDNTNKKLDELGYKTQIHCRDINFFYLEDNLRARIEQQGDRFQIVDTALSFSKAEIERAISDEPEKFSPNVILRPIYQEMILPNIAYVGGPAEVIYWLQLKGVFNHFNVAFPILMPRNFAMIIDHELSRKLAKTGITHRELFENKNYLFNHWVLKNSSRNLTVGQESEALEKIFQTLRTRAEAVDVTLGPFVGAAGKRSLNSLENIERKMMRAEKRLHADKLRQIEAVKESLFPNGSLQERTDNFLNFFQKDQAFIQRLEETLDPLNFEFNILSYTS
ncbi:MAG TPA: bacillithiol biosynthesis cysteine-adding enzyme BshC [Chryseolinea sp.]|nr:bacillithiol biosynthesis cysteine-adding enzyme BshC [Chryseolinea sp.]